jgi:hypothetical protein
VKIFVPPPQNKAIHSPGIRKTLQTAKKTWNIREGSTKNHKILRGRINNAQRLLRMPPLRLHPTQKRRQNFRLGLPIISTPHPLPTMQQNNNPLTLKQNQLQPSLKTVCFTSFCYTESCRQTLLGS